MNWLLSLNTAGCAIVGLAPAFFLRRVSKAAWRYYWIGAATWALASPIGAIISTAIAMRIGAYRPGSTATFLWLGCLVALFEEAGRLLSIRLLAKRVSRPFTLFDALMFGAGFGGAEAIWKAGYTFMQIMELGGDKVAAHLQLGDQLRFPILYISIDIFHVTMSLFCAWMLNWRRVPALVAFVAAGAYHAAANASSTIATKLFLAPNLVVAVWLAVAVVNSLVALWLLRTDSRVGDVRGFAGGPRPADDRPPMTPDISRS